MRIEDFPERQQEVLRVAKRLEDEGGPVTISLISDGAHSRSAAYRRNSSAVDRLRKNGWWPWDSFGNPIPKVHEKLWPPGGQKPTLSDFIIDDETFPEAAIVTDEGSEGADFARAILGHLCELSPELTLKVWGKIGELLDLLVG